MAVSLKKFQFLRASSKGWLWNDIRKSIYVKLPQTQFVKFKLFNFLGTLCARSFKEENMKLLTEAATCETLKYETAIFRTLK